MGSIERVTLISGMIYLLLVPGLMAQTPAAPAAGSGAIEFYMAGKKFSSLDEYEKQKAQAAVMKEEKDEVGDPLLGKTLVISAEGTVISSLSTLDAGKTISVSNGRVAGVEPSFKQVAKDFESGTAANGVLAQPVSSATQIDDDLRRKLRERHRPVLLISDRKKVRVLELEDGSAH